MVIRNLMVIRKEKRAFRSPVLLFLQRIPVVAWEREELIAMWCNSICYPLANVQMDSISGLPEDEANQYEKACL